MVNTDTFTKDKTQFGDNAHTINEVISGVRCYEKDGVAYLNLEDVARGLGFTTVAASGNEVVRWKRVEGYLADLGVPTCGHEDFIPENIFYRLAMKAKNEVAEAFQAKVADEIIPTIRRTGGYVSNADRMVDIYFSELPIEQKTIIQGLLAGIEEKQKKILALSEDNAIMKPKAEYFDELVDRNLLTNFRDTAKELGVKQNFFVKWLIEHKYIYRDSKKDLKPYASPKTAGLFELKEFSSRHSDHAGTQTLITPKGRETFRLLLKLS